MKIWTTYSVYGGTGEGETTMAYVGHAEDALEAKAAFVAVFGEFFGRFSMSVEGAMRGSVTELLFSKEALKLIERLEGKATVRAHAMLHVNRS